MERHCEIGASILSEQPKGISAFLDAPVRAVEAGRVYESDALRETAATIIMTHHEQWDGTGYPQGLKGDEIPICGQIVAVADVYDALRSHRPYKKAFSVKETLEVMTEGRGTHFSPPVFDAFRGIVGLFEDIRARFAE
jgi:putative two-component system response regulator